ncbi:MAG: transposase [Sedimenticola sp.]|nr:transposase [Sedimenticola sp.]
MPKPRKALVSLEATPYYHCVSRCVRRAFLCGTDPITGRSYEHRRGWIEQRLLALSRSFSINLCAYAVMHNHTHVVIHIDALRAASWSQQEVIERWHELFSGTLLSQRFLDQDPLSQEEREHVKTLVETWRERLQSVSWFMRCLNETIARQANAEDDCTGRFWEGRFKCQALLDEAALAACMAYVDLNPVRAGIADTPESSNYTSIQRRIQFAQNLQSSRACTMEDSDMASQPPTLHPFVGYPREPMPTGLPFRLEDYLELVDWTGRVIRDHNQGAIPSDLPPILDRLQTDPQSWLKMTTSFEYQFKSLVGHIDHIYAACEKLGKRWAHGISSCRQLLTT